MWLFSFSNKKWNVPLLEPGLILWFGFVNKTQWWANSMPGPQPTLHIFTIFLGVLRSCMRTHLHEPAGGWRPGGAETNCQLRPSQTSQPPGDLATDCRCMDKLSQYPKNYPGEPRLNLWPIELLAKLTFICFKPLPGLFVMHQSLTYNNPGSGYLYIIYILCNICNIIHYIYGHPNSNNTITIIKFGWVPYLCWS